MKKLLYIGWLGQNNIGDELMWDIFLDLCEKHGVSEKYKIVNNFEDSDLNNLPTYDVVVLGGGSLLLPGYIEILYRSFQSGSKIFIWGSGDVWAEKDYIVSLIEENTPAYLFPDDSEIILQEIIPNCEFVGVRGPLTYNLIKKSFVDISKLIISGDPGFALQEQPLVDYMPITTLDSADKIVAVNWGSSLNKIYGNDEDSVSDELAKVCNYLIDKGYKVYLYIMWEQDLKPFLDFYKKIKPSDNLIVDTNIYSGGQLMSLLKRCEFSINFKLHGNITSAVANSPFICLGYRFKCFDFVKSIDCDKLIVPTDSKKLYDDILDCINYINNNYDDIKNTIKHNIDSYKEKIEIPFRENLF